MDIFVLSKYSSIAKENETFCIKNKDTKCMCKDFKEQSSGWCECGLYLKENIDE